MKFRYLTHNNTGGVAVSMMEQTKQKQEKGKKNEAFAAGFFAGLTVIGGIALLLLLFFWL